MGFWLGEEEFCNWKTLGFMEKTLIVYRRHAVDFKWIKGHK
jgi:hypothetical protein